MGTLYIVATPIGNLDDISTRAAKTLAEVNLVLAEDTRVVSKLLNHLGIHKPTLSYHQHSDDQKKFEILNMLLAGKNIAMVSDAGTPGISDPGNELVDFLYGHSADVQIIPIPGPSAVSSALSVCGFDVGKHMFLGFWPKKKAAKLVKMINLAQTPAVFFESPHRIIKTLSFLVEALGKDKRVFVGRELTKMHETHYRGKLEDVTNKLKAEKFLKGEIVVVVE